MAATAQDHVQAYIEYRNIVGDDDGGRLLSECEYAEYKSRVAAARYHRLYVSWRNTKTGMDCRQIGPGFCGHRYRQHATDNYKDKNVHCQVKKCPCILFEYLPIRGSQTVRCSICKHLSSDHDADIRTGRRCLNGDRRKSNHRGVGIGCQCDGFMTSLSCSCKSYWSDHQTVFETKEERESQGRPVDRYCGTMYKAMGGLTGFSSLIDGVDRLAIANTAEEKTQIVGHDHSSAVNSSNQLLLEQLDNDEQKGPQLRKGKISEMDEMALYDAKYHRSYSTRSRTGLRPTTPLSAERTSNSLRPATTTSRSSTSRSTSISTSSTLSSSSASSVHHETRQPAEQLGIVPKPLSLSRPLAISASPPSSTLARDQNLSRKNNRIKH